jgi:hypothetical protein
MEKSRLMNFSCTRNCLVPFSSLRPPAGNGSAFSWSASVTCLVMSGGKCVTPAEKVR